MTSKARDDLGFSCDYTGLRATEQLVATKRDHVYTRLDRATYDGLVGHAQTAQIDQRTGTDVLVKKQPLFAGKLDELRESRRGRKADNPVIRGMNAQDQTRVFIYRIFVIRELCP